MMVQSTGRSVAADERLIVGLETGHLTRAMTGVANYTFHIVASAQRLDPHVQFVGFQDFKWDVVNLSRVAQASSAQGAEQASRQLQVKGRRMARRALGNLSRSQAARMLYRKVMQWRFASSVRSRSLDLFHAFNFRPPYDPGVPVLPVVYDLSTFRHPEFHPADRVAWLAPLGDIIARAPMVQTISEFSKREIVKVFGTADDKIFVAPPAAAAVFGPIGQDETQRDIVAFDLQYGSFFLTVGTLEPRKNIRTLIAAFARLSPAERSRCPLVVAGGKGWGSLDLPAQAETLRGDGTLRFLEGVTNLQLRSLYEGARLMLMPSLYEGFGMPVVEALACGTAVAHSADTSMDEISGDLGRRVAALDVDGWTDALRQAISGRDHDDPALRAARIAQARQFDWDRSAGLVLGAYGQLLRG